MAEVQKIPSEWIAVVCGILEERRPDAFRITTRAREDFEMIFPERFSEDMLGIMADVLKNDRYTDSRRIVGMDPTGETYAFLFLLEGRRMYGKINLKAGKIFIEVFSAHLQQKGDRKNGRFE